MGAPLAARAHAKINWALDITGLYPNGYHRLDMLMQSIQLHNALTFEPGDGISLFVDGRAQDDPRFLVLRAAHLLRQRAGYRGGARITLQKQVPDRAGLGGASADCAATLLSLNQLWGLNLSPEALRALGAQLGADVPFCLTGGLARVGGMGEELTPIGAPDPIHLLIVHPDEGLSTVDVYRRYDQCGGEAPRSVGRAAQALLRRDFEALSHFTSNALARAAQSLSPNIAPALAALRAQGARFAQMSGSGSAVFGAFDSAADCERARAQLSPHYPRCFATTT